MTDEERRAALSTLGMDLVDVGIVFKGLGDTLAAFGTRLGLTRPTECEAFAERWVDQCRRALAEWNRIRGEIAEAQAGESSPGADRWTSHIDRVAQPKENEAMPNDKPAVIAEEAQKAAAIAKEAADAIAAVPGLPQKSIVLHALAGVGVAAGAVTAIMTMGVVPGVIASLGGVTLYILGWINPTPTAVAQFGTGAK